MANFLLIVRNAKGPSRSYGKGDVIEILPSGVSPGNKASSVVHFSYAYVTGADKASLSYLKEPLVDSALDPDGIKYKTRYKRKQYFPDSVTDNLSTNWKSPTVVDLKSVTLTTKI